MIHILSGEGQTLDGPINRELCFHHNRPEQYLHYVRRSPKLSFWLRFHPTIICDTLTPPLEAETITLNAEGAVHLFPGKINGLNLPGTNSYPPCFTFSYELLHCSVEALVWRHSKNHVIFKKQRRLPIPVNVFSANTNWDPVQTLNHLRNLTRILDLDSKLDVCVSKSQNFGLHD